MMFEAKVQNLFVVNENLPFDIQNIYWCVPMRPNWWNQFVVCSYFFAYIWKNNWIVIEKSFLLDFFTLSLQQNVDPALHLVLSYALIVQLLTILILKIQNSVLTLRNSFFIFLNGLAPLYNIKYYFTFCFWTIIKWPKSLSFK